MEDTHLFRSELILETICQYLPIGDLVIFLNTLRISELSYPQLISYRNKIISVNYNPWIVRLFQSIEETELEETFRRVAKYGQDRIIQLLLPLVNIDACNSKDESALILAVIFGNISTVQILLEAGANLNHRDNSNRIINDWYDGGTALHCAIEHGHVEIAEMLLEHKTINLECVDHYLSSPLIFAAKYGFESIVRKLLEKGAKVNYRDGSGWSVLFWAIVENRIEIVRILIEFGVDINRSDVWRQTPLKWAERRNHPEIAQILKETGAT